MHGTKHSNGKEILNRIRRRAKSFLKGGGGLSRYSKNSVCVLISSYVRATGLEMPNTKLLCLHVVQIIIINKLLTHSHSDQSWSHRKGGGQSST